MLVIGQIFLFCTLYTLGKRQRAATNQCGHELGQMMQLRPEKTSHSSSKKRKLSNPRIRKLTYNIVVVYLSLCVLRRKAITIDKWKPMANLYKLHKTANNVLVPWSIFVCRSFPFACYRLFSLEGNMSQSRPYQDCCCY